MPFFLTILGPILRIPEDARQHALDRIRRATPVEEEGFHFYALPTEEEEERHLLRRPEALQFHYNGKLYKVPGERASGVFELFLDLLYVAIIAIFSAEVSHHPDWIHLLKYIIIFFHAYQIWQDLREIFDNYYTDDILQRALVFVVMACMAVFANNAAHIGVADNKEETAYYTALYSFQLVHFILILNWFLYSLFIPEHLVRMRVMGCANVLSFIVRCFLFFTTSWTTRIILALLALTIERGSWVYIYSPLFQRHDATEFSTAVNIEHESDRMTALYIIVLGEFLNGVITQTPGVFGFHSTAGRVVMVLVIAFTLNWLYAHNDGSVKNTHAIRRSAVTAMTWFIIHEPLSAALVLSGDIAAEFVEFDVLENYNLQWIFCYGLALGVFSLWVLAQCTLGRDELIWPKQVRLFMRVVDIIAFLALPFTSFDTTKTLAVASGLLIITVIWENYGSLPKDVTFDEFCYVPTHNSPSTEDNFEREVESLVHANEVSSHTTGANYGAVAQE